MSDASDSGSTSTPAADVETIVEGQPSVPASNEETLTRGRSIGRYIVLERIGGGGMGVVYSAYDPKLDRRIAIKLLRRKTSAGSTTQQDRNRMLREALALARLSHPNVIAVHDAGLHDDGVFVAMDLVRGENLRQWVAEAKPSAREILQAYVEAGRGLAAAHDAGLVHRDFKPDNAVRDERGRVRVLDFGLARSTGLTGRHQTIQDMRRELASERPVSLSARLTLDGIRMGTPAYMAPEQHRGEPTDARTDQFAFCVALYEALYGQRPFAGPSYVAAEAAAQGMIRPPPKGAKVPTWLRRVLLRGIAAKPDDRWPSMDELLEQIEHDPTRDRRRLLLIGVGALTVGGAVWGYVAERPASSCPAAEERLAAVYDDARRDAIEQAFAAAPRPYGERVAGDVVKILDEHGARWAAMHTDACEATHRRGEQSGELLDLRMACLDRNLQALGALVSRFEDADGDVVDRAVEAARDLPSLAPCADVEALREGPVLPPAADELTRELATAAAAHATGKEDVAVEIVQRILPGLRELEAPTLLARAKLLLGMSLEARGEYETARTELVDAGTLAERGGDDGVLADVRIQLIALDGERLAHPEAGHVWAQLARPFVEQPGAVLARRVRYESSLGSVLDREGKPEEALAHYRRAQQIIEEADEPPRLLAAMVEADLALALAENAEIELATQRAERALALWSEELGADHQRTAIGHATLAYVLDASGDYARALAEYDRAIDLLGRAIGPDAGPLAPLHSNAGIAALESGDDIRGERELRRALAIREATLDPDHVDIASNLANLAGLLRRLGRLDEAETLARRSLEIRQRALPADHPELASSLTVLANVLEARGAYAEALPLRERALELLTDQWGPEHPELIIELGNIAEVAARLGEHERADAMARRALRIADANEVPPERAAWPRVVLALARSHAKAPASEVRRLVDEAMAELEGRAAPDERHIIAEIAARHRWRDVQAANDAAR